MSELISSGDVKTLNDERGVAAIVVVGVLIIAIFSLDCLTPLGYAVWLLYAVPLLLTLPAPRLNPLMLAMIVTILIVVGFFLSPPGPAQSIAVINRGLGILVVWVIAAVLARHRHVERSSQYHERMYRSLTMALDVGVAKQRSDLGITAWNPAAERILGLSAEHLRGLKAFDPTWQAIHEDGTPFPLETHPGSEVLVTGVAQRDVVMGIRKPGGALRWISINAAPTFDAEPGSPSAAVVSFTDITERKKAEEAAQAASQYARSLIEASLDPLVTISAEGKITDVNEAFVQATGVPRGELLGTEFSGYFTDPIKARDGYERAFSEGFVRDCPLAIRHVGGRIIDVLYNASVYTDGGGNVLGVFAAARDVTAQTILNQQLRERNTELERSKIAAEAANLAKSDFLSHISHELRTPLNAILGFAQLLEAGTPSPTAAQLAKLSEILKAGWYLLNLINEILDLALIESGKSAMSMEPVSLSKILLECQLMFEPQAREASIDLRVVMPDSTWFVRADYTKLKQVITNLLSNAIKYNREQGTVEVSCSATTPGHLRMSVKDSGVGLSEENLAQLFQPFNRLGQEVGVKEGSGIGLAVTKKLVEMMGGAIGVQSTVGVGSEFWIELNRDVTSQRDAVAGLREGFASEREGDARGYTLLYVEDNPANLILVEQIIEGRPHIRMLSAPDGIQGVALAKRQLPDVILMDINLPGISGIEAMLLLREDPATTRIPIIALSANAMQRDVDQGLAAGFVRYLTKPIRISEFTEALDAAMCSVGTERPAA